MDLDKIIQRAKVLLVSPRTQWPVIAAEPATIPELYRNYILILAAIPPICRFAKTSLIGYAWHGFRVYRLGIPAGMTAAILEYAFWLILVYVLAWIVDRLAPNFGGERSRIQALKVVAYSFTASWVAGFGHLLPWLTGLIALAGAGYSVYLLYLGLPATMKVTQERAAGFAAVTVIIAIVLGWIVGVITGDIAGVSITDDYS